MAEIKIYGVLVNDTTEGIVTRADQILDRIQGKTQETLNKEFKESLGKVDDLTITYDDFVTKDSSNAVKSSGVFKAIDDVASHMPYIGEDGYIYTWDPALGDYVRSETNLRGPAGETGGTVHLIFDTTIMKVDSFGNLIPSSPLRVRSIKQYGETGLDSYNEGCVKWWYNSIEDETKPDGWIGWSESGDEEFGERKDVESGDDMSEFFVTINPNQYEMITFILYIDKEGKKEFDRQNIFIIKEPIMYKFDLTNENSLVPMADEEGNVLDAFLEKTQALLYFGNEQVPFDEITYSIESHDGLETAEIDNEGNVTISGWKTAWSNVSVLITATHKGNTFKTSYNIARVSGVTIYQLNPSVTSIKREVDGTLSVDGISANVMKVLSANSGSKVEKITSFEEEKVSVRYTYNNTDTVYKLDSPDSIIPVQGEGMHDINAEVDEVDIYLVRSSQEDDDLSLFIDHETIPVLENGEDSYNIFLTNEVSIVNCESDGTQVGALQNTQAIFMKGTKNLSDKCGWSYEMTPSNGITPSPSWLDSTKGYLKVAGCTISKEAEEVEILIKATYDGEVYSKVYTIGKSKRGGLGQSGYKSTVFCRTNKTPRKPAASEGTYENPVPTSPVKDSDGVNITDSSGKEIYWKDSIPSTSLGIIWATSRLFTTEGDNEAEWSVPAQMTDTKSVNIEFSPFVENPGYPDVAEDGDKWFDPTKDSDMFTNSMVWMATQELSNGDPVMHVDKNHPLKYTSWTIHRIKGEQGDAASSQYKSMVFCKLPAGTVPAAPDSTDGSFDSPLPAGTVKDTSGNDLGTYWSDGIPEGSHDYVVWMTSKIFWSDNTNEDDEWSIPQIMKDVPNKYDVQYSASLTKPTSDPETGSEWFDSDDPGVDLSTAVWMAQRWFTSDGWSAWDIVKIKGEDGKDGTGIAIKGSLNNVSELDEIESKEVGDAYLIDGELWIWDGYNWVSGGQVKGEPGKDGITYFLHMKYSDDGGTTFTGNGGEMPGKFLGTCISTSEENPEGNDPENPGDYKWAQIRGESLFRSTVFCRSNSTPSKPEGGTFDDPVPNGWYDGIPVGTAKIWSSSKLFSELGGSDTDWTEPAQMSDTATFDVEFSYNAIDDQPDTPDDQPDAWIDPDDPTFDGLKANWMATKTTENGVSSGWVVVLIRGEKGDPGPKGESGSSAIIRMRGYWEDIDDGDWILSGTSHTETSGEIIEEYVDLVTAVDENTGKEYVFKCIKSHKKSSSYDPISETYSLDASTGNEKSDHWMKAVQYHFIATDLLNAKDIIAETIQANKEEILGSVSGEWDGDTTNGEETVFTKVSTEDGMIRFFYRKSESEDWRLSVDIGYDFESDSGVLTFYASDGQTPLYNLGPNGLSASVVDSPYYDNSERYWKGLYGSSMYMGYGVIAEDTENKNFYNNSTSSVLDIDLTKRLGVDRIRDGRSTIQTPEDPDFKVKYLKIGTFVVQMSQKFIVYNPVTAEVIDYSGGTANYPSDSSPIISFGGNTIGYLGIAHPSLMYKDIKLSFDNENYGVLTSPVRKWNCVLETLTDLQDFTISSVFNHMSNDETFVAEIMGFYGFSARITGGDSGERTATFIINEEQSSTAGMFEVMKTNGTSWLTNYPNYATISFDGESSLMSISDCNYVIADALAIVGKTVQNLVSRVETSITSYNTSITLDYGVQRAFADAITIGVGSSYSVCSAYLAKKIIDHLFGEYSSDGTMIPETTIGYVFPEDKYFKLDSSNKKLILTNFEDSNKIYSSSLIDGTNIFNNLEYSTIKSGTFPIESSNKRAYLMVSSLTSNIGTINSSPGITEYGNTYEIFFSSESVNGEIKINIRAVPVNYYTALMDSGVYRMPDKYGSVFGGGGSSLGTFTNVRYGIFKGYEGILYNP